MKRLAAIAAPLLFPAVLAAAEPGWAFISAQAPGTATKWHVLQFAAEASVSDGKLKALVYREGTNPHMTIEGKVKRGKIKATAVIDGTDTRPAEAHRHVR